MKIVGVTGGIGSGKSTLCKLVAAMGYPVFYTDLEGHRQLNYNKEVHLELKNRYGKDIFDKDGIPIRPAIAAIVFKDKSELTWLNSIIHPRVKEAFSNWCSRQTYPLVFKESAILFEGKFNTDCDFSIQVSCSFEQRMERVLKRDAVNEEDVRNRIKNQMTDAERESLADFVITNEDADLLCPQILKVIELMLKK